MSDTRPEHYSLSDPSRQTDNDRAYSAGMDVYFPESIGSHVDKLRSFTKFVPRQSLAHMLAKRELFNIVKGIHGHIIECGVFLGGGLMTWAQFSAIFEPYNHVRRIVGFDSFAGFADIHAMDEGRAIPFRAKEGLAVDAQADLAECIRLYDLNRPLGHIPRVELIAGEASSTIPAYVASSQHLVVALLYLDFDLYEPSRLALEAFLPRMPRGSLLVFDQLNQDYWPGETMAVLETVGIRNLEIRRFEYTPQLSYAVLG